MTEETLLKCKLDPDDLIFPKIRTSSRRNFLGVIMKHCKCAIILNFWVKELGVIIIANGEEGKYNLHFFRIGRSQHNFLNAMDGKKSMIKVK